MKLFHRTTHRTAAPTSALTVAHSLLTPLAERAAESPNIIAATTRVRLGSASADLPRYLVLGDRDGGTPIRVALFAGLDPGRLDTIMAVSRLVLQFDLNPALLEGFALFAYPIVHLAGFHHPPRPLAEFETRLGGGSHDEDVQFFRHELDHWRFNGLITLRSVPGITGLQASVRGKLLAREIVEPVLRSLASTIALGDPLIDIRPSTPAARQADHRAGRLIPTPPQIAAPFEIELRVPTGADCEVRVSALYFAVVKILCQYRALLAHGGEL
jgi:hypothetical protein